jgi:DNA-binding transcriptional MerR regulator
MSDTLQSGPLSATQGERRGGKSASAFRTISEVARELDVPQHVLRFWESKFSQVKPLKRGGGRRYYRPEDVDLLRKIRTLLYRDGYTIKGVQKLMREGNVARGPEQAEDDPPPVQVNGSGRQDEMAQVQPQPGLSARQRAEIEAVINELSEIRKLLNG